MDRATFPRMVLPVLGVALVVTVFLSVDLTGTASEASTRSEASATVSTDAFGIRTDLYSVETGEVPPAETFSTLLGQYGVNYQTILRLVDAAKPEFEIEDLRAGQPYRVYLNPWLQQPQYFVYQISPVRHLVFDIQNPERTHFERRSVQTRWATVGGTVDGSLYQTLVQDGGHPLLALRLSEVFAWQIDFFRLRAGDQFRLIYEKRSIGGEQLQPGEIVAGYVKHRGEEYYAFRFNTETNGVEYFNRNGQSLRRQLLKAPLQYTRISSEFTDSRFHPILNEYRPHHGTDYAAPRGTPVHSVGNGVVQFAGYDGPNGNYVKIRHNSTFTSGYLHLVDIADGIHRGAEVTQGETVGYVGSTGRSTGPHLDYRLWKHGTAVNPYSIELPPSQPVPVQHRDAFERTVQALMPRLRTPSVFAGRHMEPVPFGVSS